MKLKFVFLIIGLVLLHVSCGDSKELNDKYNKALILYSEKKLDESFKMFKEVEKIDKNYKSTGTYIGKIHYYRIEFEKAWGYFVHIYFNDKNNRNALFWLIKTEYLLKKEPAKLLDKINLYLEEDSNNIEMLYIRGVVCKQLGKFDESLKSFEKVVLASDKLSFAFFEIAKFYDDLGQKDKARKYFQIAKQISDSNPAFNIKKENE